MSSHNPQQSYLRDAWYPAGWSSTIVDKPLGITILERPLVLFRGVGGEIAALSDVCGHRFAPLSMGRVEGDTIRCPYHGLAYDITGRCVHNPVGKGTVPSSLAVRRYSVVERDGMAWIWMGAEAPDMEALPGIPFVTDPSYRTLFGYLRVAANYELVVDNLLDLSHAEFLHPFLSPPGFGLRMKYRVEQDGHSIVAYHESPDEQLTGLFGLLWEHDEPRGSQRANMRWNAPANLLLDVGMHPIGAPTSSGPSLPSAHLLAPAGEFETHYFWAVGRDRRLNDPQLDGMIFEGFRAAFENEDEPMIKAVQVRMGTSDLFALKPALLPMDEAGVRARRILKKLIADQPAAVTVGPLIG